MKSSEEEFLNLPDELYYGDDPEQDDLFEKEIMAAMLNPIDEDYDYSNMGCFRFAYPQPPS